MMIILATIVNNGCSIRQEIPMPLGAPLGFLHMSLSVITVLAKSAAFDTCTTFMPVTGVIATD